ncbi:LytR C-terminal domain-containing protein [Pseudactinotalea suaedae]|uniref:LytR C-terminal domain-containing protein n=1 Tax=Pseudactinotalea suaedae TaxID=1524924 RepID=UPI0012E22907|nr:LytR C-terminal domain-containing protein [Pseudactinotalea suaedae]
MSQSTEAVRARAARRRHLQQRQTVIFGTLVAALLLVALLGGAVWSGVIPSPVSVPINSGGPAATPDAIAPPCPPADALPVPYAEINVNVLNGTDEQGLASRTATSLQAYGVQIGQQANGTPYGGVAQLTVGPLGVASAYSLAAVFTEAQIVLDSREDATVDLLLGEGYETLVPLEEVALDPAVPIVAPEGCRPIETTSPAA